MRYSLIFAGLALGLGGCAGMASVANKDMNSAPTKIFNAGQVATTQAVKNSIGTLGYDLKDTKTIDSVDEIYFSKPISAFSWGEVGRIDVRQISDAASQVSIGSEKRSQLQVTGTTQEEFADKIFKEVSKNLGQ